MSTTQQHDAAVTAQQIRQLKKGAIARLLGRSERGPDHSDDPKRRVPHRNSYDVDAPEANQWSRLGDGSVAQGVAHCEALIAATKELYHRGWKDHPLAATRALNRRRDALVAEKAELLERSPADRPAGRLATIELELRGIAPQLKAAELRLRRGDVTILEAMLACLSYSTGRLFPSYEKIAAIAGCSLGAAKAAVKRLCHHGIVSKVRRTIKTALAGEQGPQREQTSNAYFFEHQQRMEPHVWQRFKQLLTRKLRRLGAVPAAIAARAAVEAAPPSPHALALRSSIASLGASVSRHAST